MMFSPHEGDQGDLVHDIIWEYQIPNIILQIRIPSVR